MKSYEYELLLHEMNAEPRNNCLGPTSMPHEAHAIIVDGTKETKLIASKQITLVG